MEITEYTQIKNYIGMQFLVMEDFYLELHNLHFTKQCKFIVKKIAGSNALISITNSIRELEGMGMLALRIDFIIKNINDSIKETEPVCELWDKDPQGFVFKKGLSVGLGEYERIDGVLNVYSYQKGKNMYHHSSLYHRNLLLNKQRLAEYENPKTSTKKETAKYIKSDYLVPIDILNTIKFIELNK